MKIEHENKDQIIKAFRQLSSKEDLLNLLNYAKKLIYGEKVIPFELKQLTWHANPKANPNRYKTFEIRKKSGTTRTIHAPVKGLKAIQRSLNLILHCMFEPHRAATGFVPGKSIVDNAKIHTGSYYIYNIDLKDFFHSIDQARVWKCLQNKPISLGFSDYKLTGDTARIIQMMGADLVQAEKNKKYGIVNIISALCCTEMIVERLNDKEENIQLVKNVLPQGAPTSPIITNIVCQRLDYLLSAVAKHFGLRYTRYADDITFSSLHNVYQKDSDFLKELHRIIEQQGFLIKQSKTRLQKQGYRQEVTGLLVNENVNVQKRYIKQLRMWLYYWEQYGYEKANTFFLPHYYADKGNIIKGKPNMANVIKGKLDYLKMVKGGENEAYLKLRGRFEGLTKPIILKDSETVEDSKQRNFKKEEIDLSRHKPIDVSNFLKHFKTSYGLKFLTHDYDVPNSTFNRETILSFAKKEFEELTGKYIITSNLYARINQFAFGDPKEIWWFNKVKYNLNWNAPELIEWINKNPNLHPILSDKYNETMISPFKQSVEIKTPQLQEIVNRKLAKSLGSLYTAFEINETIFKDLDKANFYTDVDSLEIGLGYLFNAIKQRASNSKKIRFEFSRQSDTHGRKRILKIIHLGSDCDKPLDKEELFQGDFLEAEKAFFGICDWSIIAKSPDTSVNKLNVLFDINSGVGSREKIDDSLIDGFTHILTFYS
ncbi:hypothetical protein ABIB62_000641 [Mucilaginibacter sp. UYP25]|uniref:reverse transcriptase family protein n=1 Tax=unclassified Mucilaginibacter TaxID=2617802 RepID=UPI0033964914